ncbi:hypothetical protein [Streptomyces sp. NPDC004721]
MSNQSVTAGVALAGVMAHCGGSPVGAVEFLVGAIAAAPTAPEPYASLAELWRDRRSELKEGLEGDGSLSAVLAQAYFLFLDEDAIAGTSPPSTCPPSWQPTWHYSPPTAPTRSPTGYG